MIIAASVVFSGIVIVEGVKYPTTSIGWVSVFAIALVSTALAFVTFFAGLKRIDPANAAMISTLEPLVTVTLAVIVLGETMTLPKILGGVMILAAVVLLTRSEITREFKKS